jgi:hypothetical protein
MKPFKDQEDLAPRPPGYDGTQNGNPQADDLPRLLNDDTVSEAYKVPWNRAYGHLKDATPEFDSSVWGMGDGRKTIQQQAGIPELGKGKK